MPDEFLKSPVLPGTPVEHHEHRRLLTVLTIVIITGVVIFFAIWFSKPLLEQYAAPAVNPAETMRDSIMSQLSNAAVQLPAETVNLIRKQLDSSKATLSESQKETIRKQLEATAVN